MFEQPASGDSNVPPIPVYTCRPSGTGTSIQCETNVVPVAVPVPQVQFASMMDNQNQPHGSNHCSAAGIPVSPNQLYRNAYIPQRQYPILTSQQNLTYQETNQGLELRSYPTVQPLYEQIPTSDYRMPPPVPNSFENMGANSLFPFTLSCLNCKSTGVLMNPTPMSLALSLLNLASQATGNLSFGMPNMGNAGNALLPQYNNYNLGMQTSLNPNVMVQGMRPGPYHAMEVMARNDGVVYNINPIVPPQNDGSSQIPPAVPEVGTRMEQRGNHESASALHERGNVHYVVTNQVATSSQVDASPSSEAAPTQQGQESVIDVSQQKLSPKKVDASPIIVTEGKTASLLYFVCKTVDVDWSKCDKWHCITCNKVPACKHRLSSL